MIRLFLLTSAVATLSACSTTFIPNTDVEDTGPNKKVINFCEEYRHAVEDKNIGQILKMTSARYHEDGGNTNAEDDIDYSGFKDFLTGTFVKTQSLRYEIRYRKVTFTDTAHVLIDYTYSASYKIPGVKNDEWRHTVADNRLDLLPDGETYKIVAGM